MDDSTRGARPRMGPGDGGSGHGGGGHGGGLTIDLLEHVDSKELSVAEQEHLFKDYMRSMYVLMKSAFVHQINNATLLQSAERIAGIANRIRAHSETTAALEFLADGIYVNRALLKLDASTFDQGEYLSAVWSTLGVGEISAISDTTAEDWVQFIAAFKQSVGPGGDFQAFVRTVFPNLRLVAIENAGRVQDRLAVTDRFRALRAYSITVITLNELVDAARVGKRLRPARVKRPLQEIITLARTSSALLMALAHLKRHKLALHHHLANTAVYTICAVRRLDLPRWQMCEIALQAALHDIGRAFVAADPHDSGPVAERMIALQGVRKLVRSGSASPRLLGRVVVANEVRRWVDRSSEPAGDSLYEFESSVPSKIVAVAHAYSLLTTPLPGRPALLPDEALRVIMREAGRRYDAPAVKLLVNALGVYPVGSTVALSDGRTAVVVEAPGESAGATQPRVKIIRETTGELVDGAILDLAGDVGASVRILRCVDADEAEINPPAFLLS